MITFIVCVPGDDFSHKGAIVAGWGRKEDNGYQLRFLHEITQGILSGKECSQSRIGWIYQKIANQVICGYQRDTDSCQVS